MHSEINTQTVEDIGKHSHILWGVAGSLLTGFGIFLKKIGSVIYNRWTCLTVKVDALEKAISDLKKDHESAIDLKDAEIEHLKETVIEVKIELRESNKRIDDIMRGKK